MKTVLVVDDTKLVRSVLTKKLNQSAEEFDVLTAENGQEALEHAQAVKVDLVITDIEMPVMDGFELLAHLSNNHPEIPVFVMTANGSPEIQQRIDAMGSLKYFEKPMNIEALLAAIREVFESSARGAVNGISLASFLQLVNMESKSCTLRVKSGGQVGELYCLKGELIAAEVAGLTAEEAAIEMISWESAVIEILKLDNQKQKEIKQPLMNILMEGSRRKDEAEASQKKEKAASKTAKPAQPAPGKSRKDPGSGRTGDNAGDSGGHDADDLSSMYQWE
ncbi:MAG: response regulator [Desulfosudaceae bacterium]